MNRQEVRVGMRVKIRRRGVGTVIDMPADKTYYTRVKFEKTDLESWERIEDAEEVSPKLPKVKVERKTLIQSDRDSGLYTEYINLDERERIPYDATRNQEAHQFLLEFVEKCFNLGTARIDVHSPINNKDASSELARLARISIEEAEKRIIWGSGGINGYAHSVTYNLHIPNPNRLGLDDDLVTNLNHRSGLRMVQIGKQDLVKMFIELGYLPVVQRS